MREVPIAAFLWWSLVVAIAFNVAWAVVGDVWLVSRGLNPISDYLRAHPGAFWWSAAVVLAAFVALGLHLFLWTGRPGGPPL